jgi:hypothetical protein
MTAMKSLPFYHRLIHCATLLFRSPDYPLLRSQQEICSPFVLFVVPPSTTLLEASRPGNPPHLKFLNHLPQAPRLPASRMMGMIVCAKSTHRNFFPPTLTSVAANGAGDFCLQPTEIHSRPAKVPLRYRQGATCPLPRLAQKHGTLGTTQWADTILTLQRNQRRGSRILPGTCNADIVIVIVVRG